MQPACNKTKTQEDLPGETHQPNAVLGYPGEPNMARSLVVRLVAYSTEGQRFDPEGVRFLSHSPPVVGEGSLGMNGIMWHLGGDKCHFFRTKAAETRLGRSRGAD
jgi:hypothetical protein